MIKIFLKILIIIFTATSIFAQNNIELKANRLFFLNENSGALVKQPNTLAITTNGGKSWKNTSIHTAEVLKKVVFTSESVGWLFADSSLFLSHDSGKTWSLNHTFNNFVIGALFFQNNKNGFVGGGTGTLEGGPIIFRSEDGGESWIQSDFDTTFYDGIFDISFGSDSFGVALSRFTMYKTLDGGSNWINLPNYYFVSGDGQITPENIRVLNNQRTYLIGRYANVVSHGFINISTDEGLTFESFGNKQSFMWGIRDQFIFNEDNIWLSTVDDKLYKTNNGGYVWDTVNIRIDQFSFVSNSEAYALNSDKLMFTTDGWKTYTVIDSTVTGVNKNESLPHKFILHQNYPNPFNPVTTIKYSTPLNEKRETSNVKIIVYDILGREVETLFNENKTHGNYEIIFDGKELNSGIYFYKLQTENYSEVKKMLLLK